MAEIDADKISQPRGQTMKRRAAARLAAVQVLYQIEMTGIAVERAIAEFLEGKRPTPDGDDDALPAWSQVVVDPR